MDMNNSASVFRVFMKYVLFNILGQMVYSCYTLADTFFVSASLGADGLTALNLAFPVFCLLNGTGYMVGMGGGTGYSIAKSRGETGNANLIFTNTVYMTVCFAALFSAGLVIFGRACKSVRGGSYRISYDEYLSQSYAVVCAGFFNK